MDDAMKRYVQVVTMAVLLAGSCVFAQAAELTRTPGPAQLTLPPDSTPATQTPAEDQPIQCDLRASPDYVAGIDVQGRDVAPADVRSGRDVQINTEIFVEVRPRDRRLRSTGVIVNLPGLGAPACVPIADKSRK
jgi:PBP1b-binding outer membrane lipoprotein LpoB